MPCSPRGAMLTPSYLQLPREILPAATQAPVDVRAARQGQAGRCQRRVELHRGVRQWQRRRARALGAASLAPWQSLPRTGARGCCGSSDAPSSRAALPADGTCGARAAHDARRARRRWWWTQADAAVPDVFLATQEAFVPQMINLEVLGGVSFRKGCFPGQEVVARSQYLGKLRRAHERRADDRPGDDRRRRARRRRQRRSARSCSRPARPTARRRCCSSVRWTVWPRRCTRATARCCGSARLPYELHDVTA